MTISTISRPLLILRYTLIIATAYLLLVERAFTLPSQDSVVLIATALASNILIGRLPPRVTNAAFFGVAIVVGDTLWITIALLRSGQFDPEFFFLYFFILLLAAIGESLRLIVLGAVVVCFAYTYLLFANGSTLSLWRSPSLIRIPFLFAVAAFYGYLVERTRAERRRADIGEEQRQRAEGALQAKTEQLQAEAAVSAALARIGRELISSMDTPVLLERLCQLTAEELGSDCSQTLLWRPDEEVYAPVAAFGLTVEERELVQVFKLPRTRLGSLLMRLREEDVVECGSESVDLMPSEWQREPRVTMQVFMALRRGQEIIGVQIASWHTPWQPLSTTQRRIAGGLAHLTSMALANVQLIEELEGANRLKSDFVASMSHELRSPLNQIIGYNDLLVEGEFGPLLDEQLGPLRRMGRCSRDLLDLIQATLDLSRLESRRVPLTVQEVQMAALMHELGCEAQAWLVKPGVSFDWQVTPDQWSLHTDPVKLKMILKNLIGNAIKFTERGSVSVAAQRFNDGAEIRVSDTGIGIAAEAQKIVFEPFRQADRSVGPTYGGVGLGLYIVHQLLDLLGGTISVVSEVGRGSTFRVWVPTDIRQVNGQIIVDA